jgi:hypothetical protein
LIKYQKQNWLRIDWIAWDNTQVKMFWIKKIKVKSKKQNIIIESSIKKPVLQTKATLQIKPKLKFNNISSKTYRTSSYDNLNYQKNNWKELVNLIKSPRCPRWSIWQCWANVWNILNKLWIDWLPNSWRDWYKWSAILNSNPNFIKEKISNPLDAREWWILVYNQWYWKRLIDISSLITISSSTYL